MGGEEIYIINSLKESRGVLQNAWKMVVFLNFPMRRTRRAYAIRPYS